MTCRLLKFVGIDLWGACQSTAIALVATHLLVGITSVAAQDSDAMQRGLAAMQRGDFVVAENAFRDALRNHPRDAHAWKALGVSFAARGIHDAASEPFLRACTLDAHEPDACYYLARNHYLLNRFAESLALFDRLSEQAKGDWRYANGRGLALLALNRYGEAELAFRRAMDLERDQSSLDENPAVNLGNLFARAGEPDKAAAVLRSVVKQHPEAARAWFELGKAELQLGRLNDAESSLKNALIARPAYREAHLLLSKVYTRLGKPEQAREHRAQGLAIAQ